MNFDVNCFEFVDDGLQVVHHEYFDEYIDALEYEKYHADDWEGGVSIVPMNEIAEDEIRCVQCGGGNDCHHCIYSDLYDGGEKW